ncbi:MAG TPA: hypothetical protein VHK65_02135 [Candidatus Dormibacteraeota bacterium]|nr:hypothetical protein [Candidatus Dormibacteraeota bacterium]
MSEPPLVAVDFNAMWDRTHVSLGTLGVKWDLERQGIKIAEGLRLRGYDLDVDQDGKRDNLVCEGVVVRLKATEHNPKFDWLLATDRVGHESDFRDDPGHWAHRVDWRHEEEIRQRWREQNPGSDSGLTAEGP